MRLIAIISTLVLASTLAAADSVVINPGGSVDVQGPLSLAEGVTIAGATSPQFDLTGDARIDGSLTAKGDISLYAIQGDGNSGTASILAVDGSGSSSIGLRLGTQAVGVQVDALYLAPDGKITTGDRLSVGEHLFASGYVHAGRDDSTGAVAGLFLGYNRSDIDGPAKVAFYAVAADGTTPSAIIQRGAGVDGILRIKQEVGDGALRIEHAEPDGTLALRVGENNEALVTNGKVRVVNALQVGESATITAISDDGNDFVTDAQVTVPTKSAVKEYVDAQVGGAGFTTGDIKQTMATTEPAGWLFLNGQAVSRTGDTADLFALFGTTYGAGDGSSTFNLPDARGRVLAAVDNLGGGSSAGVVNAAAADVVGGSHGAETHVLTIAEMPAHDHDVRVHHNGTGNGGRVAGSGNSYHSTNSNHIQPEGGSQPHNNMQPTMFVNTLIKK